MKSIFPPLYKLLIPLRDHGHLARMGVANAGVLLAILARLNAEWWCKVSNERLAYDAGMSVRSLQLHTAWLERHGYISKAQVSRTSVNIYTVWVPGEKTRDGTSGQPRHVAQFISGGGAIGCAKGRNLLRPKRISLKGISKKGTKRKSSSGKASAAASPPPVQLAPEEAATTTALVKLGVEERLALGYAQKYGAKAVGEVVSRWSAKSKDVPLLKHMLKNDLKGQAEKLRDEEAQRQKMLKIAHLREQAIAEWHEMDEGDRQRLVRHVAQNQDSPTYRDSVLKNPTGVMHMDGINPLILNAIIVRLAGV